jgi:hypothetical protein
VFDLEPIFQYSRNNCVAICAFLVPANLLTTTQTSILLLLRRSCFQVRFSAMVAVILALTLFLHVATWFIMGVITPVTFILAGLGTSCIITNLVLVFYQSFFHQYLLKWEIKKRVQHIIHQDNSLIVYTKNYLLQKLKYLI